jgi:CheY-like chemotaxis protein
MRVRTALLLTLLFVGLALLLTRCPANRDGMPGQLAQAMEETTAAARSGALALDMWEHRRSTTQLTSVALTDARDEVVKAYKGIADLRADDPIDIERQRMLTASMTNIVEALNAASGTVRDVITQPSPDTARADLVGLADALESGYR